jgi:hypothetical protein
VPAVIAGVVSCPQPPLLLPGMTGRPVAEVEELRAGCRDAIAGLLADRLDSVVLVGGIAAAEVDQPQEPLSLRIGRLLLAEAGCAVLIQPVLIRADASVEECLATGRRLAADAVQAGPGSRTGLLVLADGSARRGPKAPGYLDPRAAPFDQAIEQALATGDPAGLAALDENLAAELLVAGRAPWQVLAGAVEGQRFQARTYYLGDPFGVWYPVVRWYPEGLGSN